MSTPALEAQLTALIGRDLEAGHLYGSLVEHLRGVAGRLRVWGSPPEQVAAGFHHALYGTDGYPSCLVSLDDRERVAAALGAAVEAAVYAYAACDRAFLLDSLGRGDGRGRYRDRFTGLERALSEPQWQAFGALTAANELDLIARDPGHLERCSTALRPLFGSAWFRALLPAAAGPEILGLPDAR